MRKNQHIQFTDAELEQLTVSVCKGAAAIAELWDTLRIVEYRLGLDWEPNRTSVAQILEIFAIDIDDPADAKQRIRAGAVVEAFSQRKDWIEQSRS